jgi:nucleosome assembly protein 1-like 1
MHYIFLQVRVITKTAPKPSFFHYFSDPRGNDEDEEDEEEEEGDEKKNEFQLTIDEDYECAHTFRTEIIPDAVLWFTGEAGMDEGDYEGEEDDEEGDEEGDGEDDESEGSANPASAGAPQAGAPPAPGADPNAPECKQS